MVQLLVGSNDPPMPKHVREKQPGDVWIESTWSGDQADLRTPGRWAVQDEKEALFFALPPGPLDMEIQSLPQTVQDRVLHFVLFEALPPKRHLTWIPGGKPCEWEVARLDRYGRMQARYSSDDFGHEGKHEGAMVVPIDLDYKLPVALQINRKTRNAMLKSFYRDTLFYTDSAMNAWSGGVEE